ncbi:SCO2583/SCO2584 N-terminal domain-containing protein [Streptacidiphilus carbonis]|uniref:SCO2583/SCO2584 N-terminal domain-containing protein n=1 Tax=Streptacidiphilus carbonis TaxID=105422 RepID=UPI0005AA04F0|nr:hypothetical protein [Streptacidiphilus carbonis]
MNPDGFDNGPGDSDAGQPDSDPADIFDGMVFDEAFVLAALIHEPSAAERSLALGGAARRRGRAAAGSAAGRTATAGRPVTPFGPVRGRHQAHPGRWQRIVARVMLVVIGMLAVMVAAAAVYRGTGNENGQSVQRPSSGTGGSAAASAPVSSAAATAGSTR